MSNIIRNLYEGNLNPGQARQSEGHLQGKWERAGHKFDGLQERLDEEARKKLEIFMDEYGELVAQELEQSFSEGFTLGVKLMCEVFMQD